jgi:hypothetical protein
VIPGISNRCFHFLLFPGTVRRSQVFEFLEELQVTKGDMLLIVGNRS